MRAARSRRDDRLTPAVFRPALPVLMLPARIVSIVEAGSSQNAEGSPDRRSASNERTRTARSVHHKRQGVRDVMTKLLGVNATAAILVFGGGQAICGGGPR